MLSRSRLTGLAVLLGSVPLVLSAGCFDLWTLDTCELVLNCGPGGGDAGVDAGCIPSENADPVADSCGVFVSSSKGAEKNEGTKAAPLKTLQAALDKAKGRPVYACGRNSPGA